jgi:hypothetical protein
MTPKRVRSGFGKKRRLPPADARCSVRSIGCFNIVNSRIPHFKPRFDWHHPILRQENFKEEIKIGKPSKLNGLKRLLVNGGKIEIPVFHDGNRGLNPRGDANNYESAPSDLLPALPVFPRNPSYECNVP